MLNGIRPEIKERIKNEMQLIYERIDAKNTSKRILKK